MSLFVETDVTFSETQTNRDIWPNELFIIFVILFVCLFLDNERTKYVWEKVVGCKEKKEISVWEMVGHGGCWQLFHQSPVCSAVDFSRRVAISVLDTIWEWFFWFHSSGNTNRRLSYCTVPIPPVPVAMRQNSCTSHEAFNWRMLLWGPCCLYWLVCQYIQVQGSHLHQAPI